jgi:hypothetical protein
LSAGLQHPYNVSKIVVKNLLKDAVGYCRRIAFSERRTAAL